HSTA
ncbi:pyruvate kinase, barrel domain protein, partial [Vibrio parahaemolyticus V-223/04]